MALVMKLIKPSPYGSIESEMFTFKRAIKASHFFLNFSVTQAFRVVDIIEGIS